MASVFTGDIPVLNQSGATWGKLVTTIKKASQPFVYTQKSLMMPLLKFSMCLPLIFFRGLWLHLLIAKKSWRQT
jgi:hypothetical protein